MRVVLLCLAGCGRVGFGAPPAPVSTDAPACVPGAGVSAGLVLHWKFDDDPASAIAFDSSGNGNDGMLINAPLFTTGRIGQGLEFGDALGGSQDQRLRTTLNSFDTTGDMTVAFWFTSYGVGQFDVIIDAQDSTSVSGFRILVANDAPAELRVTSDASTILARTEPDAFAYDEWNHVVVVRPAGGTGVQLLVNAVDRASLRDSGTPVPNRSFQVGGGGDTTSDFNGVLDDVRVYSRLLSDAEIVELFELPCP